MARRKELKNVASGLYGSFISRNNDVEGYWGIGKLCLFAQERETRFVRLNLLANSTAPQSVEFSKLIVGYHLFLQKHLFVRGILMSWVSSAIVELDFAPEHPTGKPIQRMTLGNLFKLTVAITDDRNKHHIVCGYNYCRPHDPRFESKSSRI